MRNVLGINCFSHDTSACLLRDGRIVAFVEEERFNRERHTKRFPDSAIAFCLRQAGIGLNEVDLVAFAHRAGLDLARGAMDALRRGSPKRLAVQAAVDANLARKELAFGRRWGCRRLCATPTRSARSTPRSPGTSASRPTPTRAR